MHYHFVGSVGEVSTSLSFPYELGMIVINNMICMMIPCPCKGFEG
jgi:hypothetical protein